MLKKTDKKFIDDLLCLYDELNHASHGYYMAQCFAGERVSDDCVRDLKQSFESIDFLNHLKSMRWLIINCKQSRNFIKNLHDIMLYGCGFALESLVGQNTQNRILRDAYDLKNNYGQGIKKLITDYKADAVQLSNKTEQVCGHKYSDYSSKYSIVIDKFGYVNFYPNPIPSDAILLPVGFDTKISECHPMKRNVRSMKRYEWLINIGR